MEMDEDKVDEAVLGLLFLTLHDKYRVWKTFDWDAMSRLHENDLITDPVNKNKSVYLTDEGVKRAEEAFQKLFTKDGGSN